MNKTDTARAPGTADTLDPAWLRDNCQCAECRDPVSGQRLIAITDHARDVTLSGTTEAADGLHVTFGPDGHQAVFTRSWLARQQQAAIDERSEDAKRLWQATDFASGPPAASWHTYLASDSTRLACLRALLSDVRVEATPANLAFTGLPIGPHTDNPYRDPVPTLQLLHCLTSAADGGESGLLDGFLAAALLRAEDPAAFDCLTRTPVTFCYSDATAELRATRPMIGVSPAGRTREVRYNSRSMQPLRPRSDCPAAAAADEMREFYLAYRAFAAILLRPALTLRFGLAPGDCVVFDNTRILHSRTGFAATGRRHLQGCYADIDGAESTVAVLARADSAA